MNHLFNIHCYHLYLQLTQTPLDGWGQSSVSVLRGYAMQRLSQGYRGLHGCSLLVLTVPCSSFSPQFHLGVSVVSNPKSHVTLSWVTTFECHYWRSSWLDHCHHCCHDNHVTLNMAIQKIQLPQQHAAGEDSLNVTCTLITTMEVVRKVAISKSGSEDGL